MIFGIGTDILEVARVEATYQKFGRRFVQRLLMPEELLMFQRTRHAVPRQVAHPADGVQTERVVPARPGTADAYADGDTANDKKITSSNAVD